MAIADSKIIIPEIIIAEKLNLLLDWIADEYTTTPDKTNSFLGRSLMGVGYDKANYYEEAVKIFVKRRKKPDQLSVTIGYNSERAAIPTIHIIIPTEEPGVADGIGFDEGDNPPQIIEGVGVTQNFVRSFSANYSLLITTQSLQETIIIYHVLRAGLIIFFQNIAFDGLMNLKFSGNDITLQQDLIPQNIYHKILSISFFYELNVVNLIYKNLTGDFSLTFKGTIIPDLLDE